MKKVGSSMRARGCLMAFAVFAVLLLLCCVLAWFVGVPRLRDSVTDSISESISTEVANQIPAGPDGLEPGEYTLSVAEIERQINVDSDSANTEDFEMSVDENGMSISFTSGTQTFGYSGRPVARDGELVMEDMEVDSGFLGWIMPADRLGDTIESGINSYFEAEGLQIDDLTLGDDEIIFVVSEQVP